MIPTRELENLKDLQGEGLIFIRWKFIFHRVCVFKEQEGASLLQNGGFSEQEMLQKSAAEAVMFSSHLC